MDDTLESEFREINKLLKSVDELCSSSNVQYTSSSFEVECLMSTETQPLASTTFSSEKRKLPLESKQLPKRKKPNGKGMKRNSYIQTEFFFCLIVALNN